MSLTNRVISNLFGGVSQQAAGVRMDNQCEELINAYPSIADGLVKRPPSEFIASIPGAYGSMFHTINRDGDEKYIVVFTDEFLTPIRVYALDGTSRSVSYGSLDEDLVFTANDAPKSYVYGGWGTPAEDLVATTVADYTIVVNKTKSPVMLAPTSVADLPMALITIPHGVASQTYKVFIDGVEKAAYTSGDSNSPETWRTTAIASALHVALSASLTGGNWRIAKDGSSVFIVNTAGVDFTFKVEDSWGDQAMVGVKESVRRFEDLPYALPIIGMDYGFHVVTVLSTLQLEAPEYFHIFVDGVDKANNFVYGGGYETPDGVALRLYNSLTVNLLSNPVFRISLDGASITIWRTDGTPAVVTVFNGDYTGTQVGNEPGLMSVAYTEAGGASIDFTNWVFAVKPDPTTQNGTYYVRWNTLSDDGKTTSGNWEECPKKGISIAFDPTTMPHRLVRMPDGNFVFAPIIWEDREVGDDISAPDPTFVGNPIQDVFFFKNRLGLLAKGNAVLSKAGGEFFDFFPTTATDVLDDDPIDSEASSKQVAVLRWGLPFQTQLVLFSDQQQFTLGSGDALLTPKTASGDLVSTVAVDRCEPIPLGSNIYFASPSGEFTAIREMFVSADTLIPDSADVTAHCPTYVPGNIKKLAACEGKDTVFVLSDDAVTSIFVYKFYWNGDEKAQSAWSKWTFISSEILYMDVIDNVLYTLSGGGAGTLILEKIILETKAVTPSLSYRLLLDRQKVVAGSYGAGVTSFTAPIPVFATDKAFNVTTKECVTVTVINESAGTFSVPGNWAGAVVIFGRPYTFDHRFSEFGMKSADPKVFSRAGRGQLRTMNLSYVDTLSFDVVVETVGRAATTQRFRATAPTTGEKRFATLGDTRTTRVSIRSDSHLPCKFAGASYETLYSQRSK